MRTWLLVVITAGGLAGQAKIQPFYAEQTLTDYTANLHGRKFLARRSDGARATVQSVELGNVEYPPESPIYSRELILPNGAAFRLVDALKAKSTWPRIPETEMAGVLQAFVNPPAGCGLAGNDIKIVGRDLVEGLETLVVQTNGSDGRKTMQWVVPALGCTAVRSTVQLAPPNGPPVLVFETKLARISLGEPDGKLFYVGTDYAEMKPSRALDLQQSALRITIADRVGASLDRKYDAKAAAGIR